jgi:hypothetical protein
MAYEHSLRYHRGEQSPLSSDNAKPCAKMYHGREKAPPLSRRGAIPNIADIVFYQVPISLGLAFFLSSFCNFSRAL